MATDLERLVVSLEANLTRFQKQMDNAGQVADRGTKKAAVAADRNLKTIEDRAGKAAANINRSLDKVGSGRSAGLQNFSFQLQDVIVQVQGGTSAVRALSQQLPQMLGGFGAFGAVAGVAVGLLGGLVTQLGLFEGSATLSADQLAKLNDELDSNKEAVQAAAQGYDALIAKLANFTELQKAAFVVQQQTTLQKELKELEEQIATVSGSVQDNVSKIRNQMRAMFNDDLDDPQLLLLGQRFQELREQLASGKLSTEGYQELRSMLEYIASRSAPALKESLQGIVDQLATTGAKAEDYNEKQKVTQAVIDTVNGAIDVNNKALIDQASKLGQAGAAADGYAKSLRDAADANTGLAFGRRAEVKTGGFGNIRDVFAKERQTGLAIPDRPDLVKPYGETFPGVDLGQVALDELSQRFAYGSGSGEIKPKKASTKKTPEDRADSRLDSLKAEIELNTKLLAAYALGDEAMAKIRAQYAAINSARQLGLKEGTAEYNDYLSNAQAAETENAALEAKLKLMAQGKSLTVEMQTEQEKLNAKLVEYKALLDAGAITQTTYERAVAKARDQNDSLAESISAVGDAITAGIQGAVSFSDALLKIGMQLLNLAAKGLFGQGPLGGLFNNLLGVASGGLLGLAGGGASTPAPQGVTNGTGFRRSFAGGGMAGPGVIRVGETGPELLSLSQRGHVTPANATRRLTGGAGGASKIDVTVSGARGSAEIQQAVAAGMEIAYRRAVAAAPGAVRQHNVRYGA